MFKGFHIDDAKLNPDTDYMKTVSRMVRLWTNFAKTGWVIPDVKSKLFAEDIRSSLLRHWKEHFAYYGLVPTFQEKIWNCIFHYGENTPFSMRPCYIYSFCTWSGVTLSVCGIAPSNDPAALPLTNDTWMNVRRMVERCRLTPENWSIRKKISRRATYHVKNFETSSGAYPAPSLISYGDSSPGAKATGAWSWPLISISFPVDECSYTSTPRYVIVACTRTALPLPLPSACSLNLDACLDMLVRRATLRFVIHDRFVVLRKKLANFKVNFYTQKILIYHPLKVLLITGLLYYKEYLSSVVCLICQLAQTVQNWQSELLWVIFEVSTAATMKRYRFIWHDADW